MKKILGFLVCSSLILSLALAGCGSVDGNAGRTAGNTPGVNDVLEAGKNAVEQTEASEDNTVTESDVISEESVSEDDNTAVTESASADDADSNTDPESSIHFDMTSVNMDKIDVDLTALSSTMVYSEVYNMMTTPDDYIGKVVKMDGAFAVFHDEGSSDYYFACIVKDATACCAQGIEFQLAGEHSYPKDYPYEGDEICVVGVYDTYKDGDSTYCTLKNAKIV